MFIGLIILSLMLISLGASSAFIATLSLAQRRRGDIFGIVFYSAFAVICAVCAGWAIVGVITVT